MTGPGKGQLVNLGPPHTYVFLCVTSVVFIPPKIRIHVNITQATRSCLELLAWEGTTEHKTKSNIGRPFVRPITNLIGHFFKLLGQYVYFACRVTYRPEFHSNLEVVD